ncbi:MAG TPA: FecR family protein [Bdellovibrionota bacterium]|nr:FecR family protein [Bdellovibrionota bacterium]
METLRRYAFSILVLGAVISASLAYGRSPSGVVLEVQGRAEFKDSTGKIVASSVVKNLRPIQKDTPFYEGETLVTGSDGKLKIQFAEGKNEVFLGPNTTLVVHKAPSDVRMKRGTRLFLDAGKIDSKVNQKYSGVDGDEYAVESRTLVAGVRGTEFSVEHDKSSEVSSVDVKSGIVEVHSKDGTLRGRLQAGEKIDSKGWAKAASAKAEAPVENKNERSLK